MIGDTINFTEYVGNGSTVTAYAIPFRFDAAGWVVVTLRNPAGDVTALEQVTDYLLGGTGLTANGYLTTVAAVPDTHVLTIYREAPGIQLLDLAINTPLPAVSLEAQLDRIAMAAADSIGQREMEARVRPTFSTTAPADTTVPWINITSRPYVLNYYYAGAWEPISGGVVNTSPTINSGALSGTLTSTYGIASTPVTFTVSGTNMTAGILVTAPTYFEVSLTSGGTYASTTTVGAAGTIASTTVYVRLAATAPVNTYNSQNIVLTSTGAATANVTTASTGNSVSYSTLIAATLIVDPAGSDNSVLYTADTSGAGGNAISVAYAAPAAQETTTVAVAGNAITVTPGTKARMLVSGTLTSDGSTPYSIGRLFYVGDWNGKAKYTFNPSNPYEIEGIFWDNSRWILGGIGVWTSTDRVATPDLVTTWVAQGTATGTPIVTAGISSAEQVITAVNNFDHSITGITASMSGLSTGAVAAVAAAYLTGGIGNVTTIPNAYTFYGDILTLNGNTLTFAA